MSEITINNRAIGEAHPPYIIAEMSANHNGSIETAYQLMEQAKLAGADALKMQTYTAETLTINSDKEDFQITEGLWAGKSLYDLYEWASTPWDWHKALFEYGSKLDLTVFSSPFDSTAVDLLEDLNAPAYKIASFEAIDLALIRYAASTKKPLIISTGMADEEEINEAVHAAREGGCEALALLHCVSGYPAPAKDYNLRTIPSMMANYDMPIGLSDHTLSNATAIASVSLGASIIEKHFTLDRDGGGPDDSFSLEPRHLKQLCEDSFVAWESMGNADYNRKSSETGNVKFRRSLYFVKDIAKGEVIDTSHVRCIRPGYGLKPKFLNDVIGETAQQDVSAGTAVTWSLVKG